MRYEVQNHNAPCELIVEAHSPEAAIAQIVCDENPWLTGPVEIHQLSEQTWMARDAQGLLGEYSVVDA